MNRTALQWMVTPLQKYATFRGRAPRAEYWWFVLFNTIVGFVLGVVDAVLGLKAGNSGLLGLGYNLIVLLPTLAVSVRRFHDIGRSGWWFLLPGGVAIVVVALVVVVAGANAFANGQVPNPLALGIVGIVAVLVLLGVFVLQLVWLCTPSQAFTNKWGPNPYVPQDVAEDFA